MPDQPSYVSYYGMQTDPFSEVVEPPFVPVAGRQKAVDTVLHLLSYSEEVVFVAGPVGSGKSTLLEQMVRQQPEDIDLVLLDVGDIGSDKELLWDLATQFNLQPDRSHSTERLQLMLQAHCQTLRERGQVPTLAIDDIDELPLETLGGLTPILQGGINNEPGLRLIGLASQPEEVRRELSALGFASGQLIELPPLTLDDCVTVTQAYFAAAGITSGVPLEPAALKRLFKFSNGRPGPYLDGVRDFMLVEAQRSRRARVIPWPHLVAGAAVVAVLVLAGLYQSGDSPATDRTEIELTAPAPVPSTNDDITGIDPALAEQSVDDVRTRLEEAMVERTRQAESPDATQGAAIPEALLRDLEEDTDQSAPPSASEPAPPPAEPVPSPPPATSTQAATPPAPTQAAEEQPLLAPAWLRNADASAFTLQVLGARAADNVLEFVSSSGLNGGEIGYVRTELDGQAWYVLLYGNFADRAAARAAIDELPGDVQALSPWPRPMSSIQDMM